LPLTTRREREKKEEIIITQTTKSKEFIHLQQTNEFSSANRP
jgi:hypothetical protein